MKQKFLKNRGSFRQNNPKGQPHYGLTTAPTRDKMCKVTKYAGVVELVDSVDLGSSGVAVQVRVLSPAPYRVFITDLTVVDTRFFFSVVVQSKSLPCVKGGGKNL